MSRQVENKPNSLWPLNSKVTFVDAWGLNPIEGRIIRKYNLDSVLVEDARGVVHFGKTWRITSLPPKQLPEGLFDDLLGGAPRISLFEELLG